MAFLPLADSTGTVQLTLETSRWGQVLDKVRREAVVRATGTVQARPEKDQREVKWRTSI